MASPPRRYVRVTKGFLSSQPGLSCGASGREVLALLVLSDSSKRIPGVFRCGINGFAEEFDISRAKLSRAFDELERGGAIAFDRHKRVLRVRGIVEADPACNPKVLTAWAADYRELPACPVRDEIRAAVRAGLTDPKHVATWDALTSETESTTVRDTVSGTVSHTPVPVPDPDPQPAAAALHRMAWCRLPMPPFAAAAAADYVQASNEIPLETFGELLQQLARSKWTTGQLHTPPTLRRLLDDAGYRDRVIRGEFAALGATWRCPECFTGHALIAMCPPTCRGCGDRHAPERDCSKLRELERMEAEQARLAQVAQERGITVEELTRQLQEEQRELWRRTNGEIRANARSGRAWRRQA